MKLAWLTDIHLNFIDHTRREQFYQNIMNKHCDGLLITGDIAEAPSVRELLEELALFLKKPVYFVLGNHDYYFGRVNEVRNDMRKLTQSNEYLFWLPASGPLQLNQDTLVVGQDGWADGRLGNYQNSRISLNDSRMIADLFEKSNERMQLLAKMQQLADYDAEQLRIQLMSAVEENPKNIIVLMHVPPFKEVCSHEGEVCNDDWLPYFSSKATGDILNDICNAYPDIHFLVLCGHTHDRATYNPFPNLMVETGHAEYYQPEIQKIVIPDHLSRIQTVSLDTLNVRS